MCRKAKLWHEGFRCRCLSLTLFFSLWSFLRVLSSGVLFSRKQPYDLTPLAASLCHRASVLDFWTWPCAALDLKIRKIVFMNPAPA